MNRRAPSSANAARRARAAGTGRLAAVGLAAAVLAGAARTDPAIIDRLTREAHRIVIGRVVRVHELDGGASGARSVAAVRVERRFVGPADEPLLYVVETFPRNAPDVGDLGVFFLEPWDGKDGNAGNGVHVPVDGTRRRVAAWRTRTAWSPPPGGRGLRVPLGLVEEARSGGVVAAVVPVAEVLEASISRCLPAVDASILTLGPGWRLSLEPDRRIVEDGRPTSVLASAAWAELLGRFDEAGFPELPATLGESPFPDAPVRSIGLRTRSGRHVVHILPRPPESPASAAQWERARALWNALPGNGRPRL
jgi:hypothetical protein